MIIQRSCFVPGVPTVDPLLNANPQNAIHIKLPSKCKRFLEPTSVLTCKFEFGLQFSFKMQARSKNCVSTDPLHLGGGLLYK